MGLSRLRERTLCWSTSRSYCRELTGRLAWPMIRRFTEYSASWVRMPARMAGMPQAVWNRPVTRPASTPARKAPSMARGIGAPAMVSMMKVAPPVAMVPSTVRSATSRIRNVMYTPMAMMPQMSPWAATPGRALTRCMMFKCDPSKIPGPSPEAVCCSILAKSSGKGKPLFRWLFSAF